MIMNNFKFETTADEVAIAFADQIVGKSILITGVSPNGLGSAAALSIARGSPKLLILASRNPSNIQLVAKEIAASFPSVETRALVLDLASLASVRRAAAEVNKYTDVPQIDVLINNAGIMAVPYGTTEDGFERQFGTNHIGHFVFTNLIISKIPRGGRIVNVASAGHRFSDVRYDDPGFNNGEKYDKLVAYGQAKTANMLFSVELAKRLHGRGVLSFSVHPGVIMTNLSREMSEDERNSLCKYTSGFTLQQGVATYLAAAFDPNITESSGKYLADCQISEPLEKYAADPENAKKLWELSEKLVGEKFDI
ncbi:short-chain dehydrogenase [Geopyxis carbonaria]|nr:short-chain dehydrogenase [Geopyxis carbonaria]